MKDKQFLEMIDKKHPCDRVLDTIKKSNLPLVMWGTGSLAHSVKYCLEKNGIRLACCWVDNRDHNDTYEGLTVKGIEQIQDEYGAVNVIIGHSHYELRGMVLKNYPFVKACYCIVNVCYGIYAPLEYEFIEKQAKGYADTYELLGDELSGKCMAAYLNCKLTEDITPLLPCLSEPAQYFDNPFFKLGKHENYVDVGAYNGDTIKDFLKACGGEYDNIYAFEPEGVNFSNLKQYVSQNNLSNIYLFQSGCWSKREVLTFEENQERSGINLSGTSTIEVDSLDNLLGQADISVIKINFLYGVEESLMGASQILKKQSPNLIVTVGFDQWALLKIPKLIKKINPDFHIFLRFGAAMPARLTLYASSRPKMIDRR